MERISRVFFSHVTWLFRETWCAGFPAFWLADFRANGGYRRIPFAWPDRRFVKVKRTFRLLSLSLSLSLYFPTLLFLFLLHVPSHCGGTIDDGCKRAIAVRRVTPLMVIEWWLHRERLLSVLSFCLLFLLHLSSSPSSSFFFFLLLSSSCRHKRRRTVATNGALASVSRLRASFVLFVFFFNFEFWFVLFVSFSWLDLPFRSFCVASNGFYRIFSNRCWWILLFYIGFHWVSPSFT